MRRLLTHLATITGTVALILIGLTIPAQASVCGDTEAQWVGLGVATWSGTAGSDSLTLAMTTVAHAAATVHGVVPVAGPWQVDTNAQTMLWTGSTEGYSYLYQVSATSCSGGQVTQADGGGQDALFNVFSVSITRVT